MNIAVISTLIWVNYCILFLKFVLFYTLSKQTGESCSADFHVHSCESSVIGGSILVSLFWVNPVGCKTVDKISDGDFDADVLV